MCFPVFSLIRNHGMVMLNKKLYLAKFEGQKMTLFVLKDILDVTVPQAKDHEYVLVNQKVEKLVQLYLGLKLCYNLEKQYLKGWLQWQSGVIWYSTTW